MIKELSYRIHDVMPYINWVYFFHAWGFPPKCSEIADIHACPACRQSWLSAFLPDKRGEAECAVQLYDDAIHMLNTLDEIYRTRARFALLKANSHDDDIMLTSEDGRTIQMPFLRQQHSSADSDNPNLCLSDFIRPAGSGTSDTMGIFAATVEAGGKDYDSDPYKSLLYQTLCDRLAEATAERMHEEVRKHYWGYAPNEDLSMKALHDEQFQGIRPAIGYPSLPDQSIIFIIDELLSLKAIGITLTENGAMTPHATVCGLMFAHPRAHYFGIGKIGEDQLNDYAKRRGLPLETIRKFLTPNLLVS